MEPLLEAPGASSSRAICLEGTNSGFLQNCSPEDAKPHSTTHGCQTPPASPKHPPHHPAVLDSPERWRAQGMDGARWETSMQSHHNPPISSVHISS